MNPSSTRTSGRELVGRNGWRYSKGEEGLAACVTRLSFRGNEGERKSEWRENTYYLRLGSAQRYLLPPLSFNLLHPNSSLFLSQKG